MFHLNETYRKTPITGPLDLIIPNHYQATSIGDFLRDKSKIVLERKYGLIAHFYRGLAAVDFLNIDFRKGNGEPPYQFSDMTGSMDVHLHSFFGRHMVDYHNGRRELGPGDIRIDEGRLAEARIVFSPSEDISYLVQVKPFGPPSEETEEGTSEGLHEGYLLNMI
tara:strand:+ start:2244 stop:2738 length:495 start_codon:yes stop_codon:yes gene_type:complete